MTTINVALMKNMTNMSIKVETMTETKTKKEETPNVQEK